MAQDFTVKNNAPLSDELILRIKTSIQADTPRLVDIFKDIHQNPELGFTEFRTSKIIADEFTRLGYKVETGMGKTGVVGILENGAGPKVMYRADMDALPVEEKTGLPYASTKVVKAADGSETHVGHMCGHDAHVTWMLAAAKVMVEMKDKWNGTLIFIGQPAEELIEGGSAVANDGLYTTYGVPVPESLVAMHTAPFPVGLVGARGGTMHAGTDQIDITFYGVGGHGSTPQYAKDPIVMAAMAIVEYQMIVSRIIAPDEMGVVTVGAVQAGMANNVIPDHAVLKVNLRFFSMEVRETMLTAIKNINEGIARTYGMPEDKMPTMVMKGHSPPLVNDDAVMAKLQPTLRKLLGDNNVVTQFPAATGSEDAHMLRADHEKDIAMAYLAVGVADPGVFAQARKEGKEVPYAPHNPNYIVDLKAIPVGAEIGTSAILELLVKS